MKQAILLLVLSVFVAGCTTSSKQPLKKTVDGVYDGSKDVEKAIWDAM